MEWVRVARSVYGQTELTGASWDPLILFVGFAVAVIVLHALYKAFIVPRLSIGDGGT
jgi:hypothetical protein